MIDATPAASWAKDVLNDDVTPKLKNIFQAQSEARAGSIHMVGLRDLRTRLGTRWADISTLVFTLTAKLLNQTLGPADVWFRHGEDNFIIVFFQLNYDESALVCARLVEELQRMLLGNPDTAAVRVYSAVRQIGSEIAFLASQSGDLFDPQAQPAGTSPADRAEAATTDWASCLAARQEAPIEAVYRPVWDIRKQVLSIYLVRAMRPRRGRLPLWGYDCIADAGDSQEIAGLDIEILQQAINTYHELYKNRFRCFLSVHVHFETLASLTRRREYDLVLRSVPKQLLPFLMFHIVGLPTGVPTSRAAELVTVLRPYSKHVSALVDIGSTDWRGLSDSGLQNLHTMLPPGAGLRRWEAELTRFQQEAARRRFTALIEGVDTPILESFVEKAGYSYMAGDLIGPWAEVPEHAVRFTRADLKERPPGP